MGWNRDSTGQAKTKTEKADTKQSFGKKTIKEREGEWVKSFKNNVWFIF